MVCDLTKNPSKIKGFSLLESLVALVILSMSLAVLYQSMGTSTRIVNENQQQVKALILAESLLASAEVMLGQQASIDGASEPFTYRLTSRSLPEHPLEDEFPLRFVEVTVSWSAASRPRQLQLYTIIPGRAIDGV